MWIAFCQPCGLFLHIREQGIRMAPVFIAGAAWADLCRSAFCRQPFQALF